ncbi:MAG TPA: polysaccharide biosynthesis/export family protein [Fimbriimonas sp.]
MSFLLLIGRDRRDAYAARARVARERRIVAPRSLVPWWVGLLLLLLLQPASAFGQEDPDYVLGPEDVIAITVLDLPKFSGEYTIPDSGVISLPVIGDLKVAGMTLERLRAAATDGYRKRLVNPEVAVVLKVPRPKRIYVFGDVQKPGIIELKQGWRVQETLSAAGGLATGIEQRDVKVILERPGGERIEAMLEDALGRAKGRFSVRPGDVLRVHSVASTPVYVTGRVKTPGLYRLREREAGVLEAIAQAGGVLEDANITSVRIIHLGGSEETVDLAPALLRGESVPAHRLGAGDMILVAESQARFAILGYVNKPGYYSIPSGKTLTLSQALALAEGNEKRGRLSRVGLLRIVDGKEVRQVFDFGRYLTKGDPKSNPEILAGDVLFVPETDKVDLGSILSALASGSLFFGRLK